MSPSVLLDTSFLISFADGRRKHHAVAMEYYRYLLETSIPIYLSSLVAAEFAVRQPVTDLPLRSFRVLPFNLTHAIQAAALDFKELRKPEDARAVVKEDIKILAQAASEDISHVLTEDAQTLYATANSSARRGGFRPRQSGWWMASTPRGSSTAGRR